jgi:molybdate transport system substrate-binding protein
MRSTMTKVVAGALALAFSAGVATAAEVRLIAVGALRGALDKIVADYTKETGNQVNFTAGSPPMVAQKLVSEPYDVVVQSVAAMDDAAKAGAIKADTRVGVARGGIGLAVRKGAAVPDLSTPDAFKKALMAASVIVITDPAMPNASGIVTQHILEDAGIMDAIKPKVKVIGLDPGQQAISKGEADIGFFNISEVRDYVTYAGPVPAPLQKYTTYQAALTAKAAAPDAAAAFVKMLASGSSAERWKSGGLEPQGGK